MQILFTEVVAIMRRLLFWLAFHVRLGPLAPWVMGLAIGRWPNRVDRPHSTDSGKRS